jgi:hypothetical protein
MRVCHKVYVFYIKIVNFPKSLAGMDTYLILGGVKHGEVKTALKRAEVPFMLVIVVRCNMWDNTGTM